MAAIEIVLNQNSPSSNDSLATSYVRHPDFSLQQPILFAVFAAITWALRRSISGRLRLTMAWSQYVAAVLGAVLINLPGIVLSVLGMPKRDQNVDQAFHLSNMSQGLGYLAIVASMILFLVLGASISWGPKRRQG